MQLSKDVALYNVQAYISEWKHGVITVKNDESASIVEEVAEPELKPVLPAAEPIDFKVTFLSAPDFDSFFMRKQYEYLFNVAYIGCMQSQLIKQELYSVLSAHAIVLAETAKWLIPLSKEQKQKYVEVLITNSKQACLYPVNEKHTIEDDHVLFEKQIKVEK